jgi:hypothetical protein
MSTMIAFFSTKVLSLIVGYTVSCTIWSTLASIIISPTAKCIISMHLTLIEQL